MKKIDWNRPITWKDYRNWCLISLAIYLPIYIWYMWKVKKEQESWLTVEPIIDFRTRKEEK